MNRSGFSVRAVPPGDCGRSGRMPANGALACIRKRRRADCGPYLIAIGLMIACTAPVMRDGPRVKRNSQAWSLTISAVSMFSRM